MKLAKAFYHVYKNSLYNVRYYPEILKVKRRFSLKYFLALAVLATVITTVSVAVPLVPQVEITLDNLLYEISQTYPKDLVLTAKNGEWSINQPEPYVIETPQFFEVEKAEFPTNFVVFDHNGTINDVENRDVLILVNKANLITRNSQGNLEVYPLDSIPDGEINKQTVESTLDSLREYLAFVPYLIIVFVLLGTLFYFTAFRLMYLFFLALLLLAVGNIKQLKYDFSTYYKVGLHAITLPLTIELAFVVLGVNIAFPFWFLLLNLAYGIIIVYYLADSKTKKKKKAAK